MSATYLSDWRDKRIAALERELAESKERERESAKDARPAVTDIAIERRRQIEVEGWHAGHDDEHDCCQLARAAACYAMHGTAEGTTAFITRLWPWGQRWWKPRDYRRNLVKAGALIVAEIERLDRALAQQEGGE